MKCFAKKNIILLCVQHIAYQALAQINVGVITNGVPSLTMNVAQLSDTLAFVLNGATLQNSTAEIGTDTLGTYYYIKADGIRSGQANPSQIAVILASNGSTLMFSSGTGCTMESKPSLHCTSCVQTIHERCKRQTCSCKPESRDRTCTSRISFSSNN
ncbi:MAG: hypothetical protein ABMA02_15875 [Saprospiraceae bacterium]